MIVSCRNIDEPARPQRRRVEDKSTAAKTLPAVREDKHSGSVCDSGQVAVFGPPLLEGQARSNFARWGWRTVIPLNRFARSGKWGETGIQGVGEHGRILCLCGCGIEVPTSKRYNTKAKANCWETWAKVHDPGMVRRAVFKRDKGVCAECKCDTQAMRAELGARVRRRLGGESRSFYGISQESLSIASPAGFPSLDRHWWEADHKIPVVEGGGCCELDGYRTLCIPCHKKASAALAARLAEKRRQQSGQSVLLL